MAWSQLAAQFCLELAFGVLFALAFVPRAPVGALFYRVAGTSALVPLLLACALPLWSSERGWTDPVVLMSGIAICAYPAYSGPLRGKAWAAGLGVGLFASAIGVGWCVAELEPIHGGAAVTLAAGSALATGTVAGSVAMAMLLGHWYLTVPNLKVAHLERLNRVTAWSMVVSLAMLALVCLVFAGELNERENPLLGATGLFYLGTRVGVGLVMPLAFAWMAAGSLKFQNTRSATGILYASTVLVLIGSAVALSLQDTYGVPL